jgi:hypothetical protein
VDVVPQASGLFHARQELGVLGQFRRGVEVLAHALLEPHHRRRVDPAAGEVKVVVVSWLAPKMKGSRGTASVHTHARTHARTHAHVVGAVELDADLGGLALVRAVALPLLLGRRLRCVCVWCKYTEPVRHSVSQAVTQSASASLSSQSSSQLTQTSQPCSSFLPFTLAGQYG